MKRKKKLLYLTNTSRLSGAEKVIYDLATNLAKERYKIKVCTIKDDLEDQLLDRLREQNIDTACLGLDKKWKIWKVFKFLKVIKNFKPDIIHTHLFHSDMLGRLAKLLIFRKFILISSVCSSKIKKIRKLLLKMTDFLNNKTVVISKKVLLTSKKITSNKKIKLIYNGVDFNNYRQSQPKNNLRKRLGFTKKYKIFLSVGRLKKAKGYSYLIKAFSELNLPNTKLVILGEGEERKKLEKLIQKQGVVNKVLLKGRVNNVPEYLQIADLFIMSSLWEGFSLALIEAGYFGVPVIATKTGIAPEIIENKKNGILIESGSVKEIKKGIKTFIGMNEANKEKIKTNIREMVRNKFSTQNMVENYDKLYRKLVSCKK